MSDFESQPPLGLAPLMDTQANGADETSETSPNAASEETVHPETANASGDSETPAETTTEETPAEGTEVFYEEGGKKFSSFDEYRDHVNKQRAAASRIAHEKKMLEQERDSYKAMLDKVTSLNPAPAKEQTEEEDPELQRAIETLRKKGFVTKEELDQIVQEKVSPLKQYTDRLQQEEMSKAQVVVDEFINLNPDTLDHSNDIQRALKALEDAKLPGGIEKAYFLVTGRQPRTKADAVIEQKRETKVAKAAQAGGAPSQAATGVKKEDDIFGNLLKTFGS